MFNRILRAFRNDVSLYGELKGNPAFASESWMVLAISIVISAVLATLTGIGDGIRIGIVGGFISALGGIFGYLVLVGLAWFIGTKLAKGTASVADIRAAVAYAYCIPAILIPAILTPLPIIGFFASLWLLVTESSALRETLGIGKGLTFLIVMLSVAAILLYSVVISGILFALMARGAI
jgi:hypothetical protein